MKTRLFVRAKVLKLEEEVTTLRGQVSKPEKKLKKLDNKVDYYNRYDHVTILKFQLLDDNSTLVRAIRIFWSYCVVFKDLYFIF